MDKRERKQKRAKLDRKAVKRAQAGYHSSSDDEEDETFQAQFIHSEAADESDHLSEDDDVIEQTEEEEVKPSKKGPVKMSLAIQKMLEQESTKTPILSKKTHFERQLDDAKVEAKAKKALAAQKKNKEIIGHVIPDHTTMESEKQLRKVATRGVVQLFNAIRAAQKTAEEVKGDSIQKHVEKVPVLSKEVFLKSLKTEAKPKKTAKEEEGPSWVQPDFAMNAPKHWDQEDDEDEPEIY